jgi:hypothetical protein
MPQSNESNLHAAISPHLAGIREEDPRRVVAFFGDVS